MFHIGNAYPYRYIQHETKQIGTYEVIEHQLTFTSRFNHQYMVIVEEYTYHIFVIKFYLKAHKNSKDKYKLITKQNDIQRIIATCLSIMNHFLEKIRIPLSDS